MKKYLTVLCLLALSCASSIAFANYLVVTTDQVLITTEGMFVTVDGEAIEVESLNMSNNGYIVAIPNPRLDICPNCGRNTYTRGRFCSSCGFPDDANKNALCR